MVVFVLLSQQFCFINEVCSYSYLSLYHFSLIIVKKMLNTVVSKRLYTDNKQAELESPSNKPPNMNGVQESGGGLVLAQTHWGCLCIIVNSGVSASFHKQLHHLQTYTIIDFPWSFFFLNIILLNLLNKTMFQHVKFIHTFNHR